MVSYNTLINAKQRKYSALNNKREIGIFQDWIIQNVVLNTSINTSTELDEPVESFTNLIYEAAFAATPQRRNEISTYNSIHVSAEIRALIQLKRIQKK